MGSQCGGAASALGGVPGHFSGSPVHHGGKKCGGRFPELLSSGSGHRMDLGSEGGGRVEGKVASYGRSLCHLSQLPSTGLLLPSE